jgi:putative lipoprotein
MIARYLFPMLLATPLVYGCGSHPQGNGGSEKAPPATAAANVIKGTVAYRERMALPADAEVEVWILDAFPGIVTAVVTADTTIKTGGKQVPIPFEIRYEPSRIVADHPYVIKAAIRSGVQEMFSTPDGTPVITLGSPSTVNLMLQRMAADSGDAGAAPGAPAGGADPLTGSRDYLKALQSAERYAIAGQELLIYVHGTEKPLRFARQES